MLNAANQGKQDEQRRQVAPRALSEQPRAPPDVMDDELDWINSSADDVGVWIDGILGKPCGSTFRENKIDGPTLLELEDDDLRSSLGITAEEDRLKIMEWVRVFQIQRADLEQSAANRRWTSSASAGTIISASGFDSGTGYLTTSPTRRKGCPGPGNRSSCGYPTACYARRNGRPSPSDRMPSGYPSSRSPSKEGQRFDDNSCLYSVNGSLSNRASRYTVDRTDPGKSVATVGLNSCFGLDSPSYSVRGSLPTAPRPAERHSGPGPGSYNTSSVRSFKPGSPRGTGGTFGTSTRNTGEHFVKTDGYLSGGDLETSKPERKRVKGGKWPQSERWRNHPLDGRSPSFREGLSPKPLPGPADYRPKEGCLSTFR